MYKAQAVLDKDKVITEYFSPDKPFLILVSTQGQVHTIMEYPAVPTCTGGKHGRDGAMLRAAPGSEIISKSNKLMSEHRRLYEQGKLEKLLFCMPGARDSMENPAGGPEQHGRHC